MAGYAKRSRGKNFTQGEEHILLNLALQHRAVLENKKSDAATWRLKNETWEKIADSYTSRTGVQRPWKALRDKYDNLKKRNRSKCQDDKWKIVENECPETTSDSVSEHWPGLIEVSATKLENEYDDDTNSNSNHSNTEFDGNDNQSLSRLNNGRDNSERSLPQEDIQDFEELGESNSPMNPGQFHSIRPRPKNVQKQAVFKRKKTLEDEKLALMKLQQDFYRDENSRAAEKHQIEMEKQQLELQGMQLRNQLLEMEIEQKIKRESAITTPQTNGQ